MKYYQVLLFALCISVALTCGDGSKDSKEACNGHLTDAEKEAGMTHCCFFRYKAEKQNEVKTCRAINQYQFDHFSDIDMKGQKWTYGTDDLSIDCSSAFTKLSLLSLILILL